jgi:hypothetical protein
MRLAMASISKCFQTIALVVATFCDHSWAVEPVGSWALISTRKIWDKAPHNAFTDLAYWNDQFVCAFREGRKHVSTDGKIRVLTSPDGDEWRSSALIALDGYDLRDAGLSIDHLGRLMLIGGAAPRQNDNEAAPTGTFVAFSSDTREWSRPRIVVEPGRWLWRVTWQNYKGTNVANAAFGVSYAAQQGHPFTALLASNNRVVFHEVVPKLFGEGYPTEAVLRFDDQQTMYCLQRRDGDPPHNSAFLGVSKPPYTDWQWHDLGIFFGGPNFIQLPNGRWPLDRGGPSHRKRRSIDRVGRTGCGGKEAAAGSSAAERRRHKLPRARLARRPTMGELLLEPRRKNQHLLREHQHSMS